MGYLPQNGNVKDFGEGFWDTFENQTQLNNTATRDYKEFSTHYSLRHDSVFDFHDDESKPKWMTNMWNNRYAPRNAKRFFVDQEARFAKSVLNITNEEDIDLKNKVVHQWKPHGGVYDSMGNLLEDLPTDLEYDEYLGSYDIMGVINIANTTSTNRGADKMDSMVVNVVDSDGKIIKEDTDKLNENYADSGMNHRLAIVLKNKNGVTFYAPIENSVLNSAKFKKDLGEYDNLKPSIQDNTIRKNEQIKAEQLAAEDEVPIVAFWDKVNGDKNSFKSMISESIQYSKNGQYDGVRNNVIKSFYAAFAQKDKGDPSMFEKASKTNAFTNWITQSEAEQKEDYDKDMRNYGMTGLEIIKKMMAKDKNENNQALYERWINNYSYLERS
jgi:hypothetical protein